jgi:hypothetical protein
MDRRGVVLGVLIVLCGSAAAQTLNTAPPKTIWDSDLDGTAIHLQSGLQCPNATGDFRRTQLVAYDKVGLDVSCNYRNVRTGDDITIYLTRRDPTHLQQDFDSARQAVITHTPTARARDTVLAAPKTDLKWLQAGFTEHDEHVASDLFLTALAGWEYEIRATYRPDNAPAVSAAIVDLDATLMKTAGAHLAACAAVAAPARAGQQMRSPKILGALVISGATRAMLDLPKVDGSAQWCAENGISLGGQPFLDWRNVAPGAVAVERITGLAGPGPRVYLLHDPAALEVAAKSDPGTIPADGGYVVVVDGDESISVMDIYAGYPPLADVVRLLVGSHPLFAAVSKTDKKITLFTSAVNPH